MKSKECKAVGCSNGVWSKGYCKNHLYLIDRSESIQERRTFKKTSLRKRSTKYLINREDRQRAGEVMIEFFLGIWNKLKEKKCWSCGAWLGREPSTAYFDHILDKDKYPELKYDEDNIFICCLECHDAKGRGFPKPKHKEVIEQAKIRFKIEKEE